MRQASFIYLLRWVAMPLAALIGLFAAIVLSGPLNMLIHYILWTNGNAMPGKMFLMQTLPFDGALAASLFIQFGTYTAPSNKKGVAFGLLVIGGLIAWELVGQFYSPQFSYDGPIRVWWPIVGTYIGGMVTFAYLCIVSRNGATALASR